MSVDCAISGFRRVVGFAARCLSIAAIVTSPAYAGSGAGSILVSDQELHQLQVQPEKVESAVKGCETELTYQASPVSSYSPANHYSAAGVVPSNVTRNFSNDGTVAYRAALCFALTRDERFARHAQEIIDAWATTVTAVDGEQGRAEFNFYFPLFVVAASTVRSDGRWDDSNFRRFVNRIVTPLSNSYRPNNHGDWGVLLETTIGAYTGDKALLSHAMDRWQALAQSQIAQDGSLPLETCRTDTTNWCDGPRKGINGLHYTHWTLLPISLSAKVLAGQGGDVWHSSGGEKLSKAFARAARWSLHPETFPFYERNGGKLNDVTNAPYFALLAREYANEDAAHVLSNGNLGSDRFELALIFG